MTRVIVPGIATLIVVASLVALAGWNRSSPPRLAITLTEREVSLPWSPLRDDRDPVPQLAFEYEPRLDPLDARNWLTDDRLRALGFNLDVPATAPDAERVYGAALPRVGWVAFEYGGPAWQDVERRRQLSPDPVRHGSHAQNEPSRLVPVDAGPDADALVSRYPSGHLVVRATFGLRYRVDRQAPLVHGVIERLHPHAVTVPRHLRDRLAGLRREPSGSGPRPPRYEVDLGLGRLGVPYIRDIQRRELVAQ